MFAFAKQAQFDGSWANVQLDIKDGSSSNDLNFYFTKHTSEIYCDPDFSVESTGSASALISPLAYLYVVCIGSHPGTTSFLDLNKRYFAKKGAQLYFTQRMKSLYVPYTGFNNSNDMCAVVYDSHPGRVQRTSQREKVVSETKFVLICINARSSLLGPHFHFAASLRLPIGSLKASSTQQLPRMCTTETP